MLKAKVHDNDAYTTQARPSFQRELIVKHAGSAAFRDYVRELKRLEGIIAGGRIGRDPNQTDVYDRMLRKRREDEHPHLRGRRNSTPLIDRTMRMVEGSHSDPARWNLDEMAKMINAEETKMLNAEEFIHKNVHGKYHGHKHSNLSHASASTHTGLEKHLQEAIKDPRSQSFT